MSETRPTVLVLLGCFARGVEATGPNQSMLGMARALRDHFRFRVIAQAVDGDQAGHWTKLSGLDQLPLRIGPSGARGLGQAIRGTPHAVLITNGFFDRHFTIKMLALRRLGRLPRKPILIAPRGEFSPGALALGNARKRAYIMAAKALGGLRGVDFQATSAMEADEIRRGLNVSNPVHITPNIRSILPPPAHRPRQKGAPLRIAFLSRIDRKKNLHYLLARLGEAGVPARLRIYGPVTNEDYWAQCQRVIATLPPSVSVRHEGAIPNSDVPQALADQDLFFLPTLGENYGHSIVDAFLAGTPALLSDQTPWRNLEESGAGWDLPLAKPAAFVDALRGIDALDDRARAALRASTRHYGEAVAADPEAAKLLRDTLDALIDRHRGSRA